MSAITTIGAAATMTSREIAEFAGKEHGHVMRDIRVMLDELKKDASSFGGIYFDAYGREKPCFILNRELTDTLLTGYSITARNRVIRRWHELEAATQKMPAPAELSRLDILKLAMDSEEGRLKAEAEVALLTSVVEEQAPKVEAFDILATESDGAYNLRESAKLAQWPEKKFIDALSGRRWIFRNKANGHWVPHAVAIQKGWMQSKIDRGTNEDGISWSSQQAFITAKGLTYLARKLGSPGADQVPQAGTS